MFRGNRAERNLEYRNSEMEKFMHGNHVFRISCCRWVDCTILRTILKFEFSHSHTIIFLFFFFYIIFESEGTNIMLVCTKSTERVRKINFSSRQPLFPFSALLTNTSPFPLHARNLIIRATTVPSYIRPVCL